MTVALAPARIQKYLGASIDVAESEFARHLTYPDGKIPAGRSSQVAREAVAWFVRNAAPFFASRRMSISGMTDAVVSLEDGTQLTSVTLARRLEQAGCHAVQVLAVSAGAEVDREIRRRWEQDRPDAAFALNAYAAATTEKLVRSAGSELCGNAGRQGETLLPHHGPGYEDWDLGEQSLLMRLIRQSHPGIELQLLDSGLLQPMKSMLAVAGVTRHASRVKTFSIPCAACTLFRCKIRRAPYVQSASTGIFEDGVDHAH